MPAKRVNDDVKLRDYYPQQIESRQFKDDSWDNLDIGDLVRVLTINDSGEFLDDKGNKVKVKPIKNGLGSVNLISHDKEYCPSFREALREARGRFTRITIPDYTINDLRHGKVGCEECIEGSNLCILRLYDIV